MILVSCILTILFRNMIAVYTVGKGFPRTGGYHDRSRIAGTPIAGHRICHPGMDGRQAPELASPHARPTEGAHRNNCQQRSASACTPATFLGIHGRGIGQETLQETDEGRQFEELYGSSKGGVKTPPLPIKYQAGTFQNSSYSIIQLFNYSVVSFLVSAIHSPAFSAMP